MFCVWGDPQQSRVSSWVARGSLRRRLLSTTFVGKATTGVFSQRAGAPDTGRGGDLKGWAHIITCTAVQVLKSRFRVSPLSVAAASSERDAMEDPPRSPQDDVGGTEGGANIMMELGGLSPKAVPKGGVGLSRAMPRGSRPEG